MSDLATDRYRAEFRALGVAQVRHELLVRRWPKDKLIAAREWVEREDVGAWMATNPGTPKKKAGRKKWLMYALMAGGALFGISRLLRMMGFF